MLKRFLYPNFRKSSRNSQKLVKYNEEYFNLYDYRGIYPLTSKESDLIYKNEIMGEGDEMWRQKVSKVIKHKRKKSYFKSLKGRKIWNSIKILIYTIKPPNQVESNPQLIINNEEEQDKEEKIVSEHIINNESENDENESNKEEHKAKINSKVVYNVKRKNKIAN